MFRKTFLIVLVLVLIVSLLTGCGKETLATEGVEKTTITIATGGTGGTYYPLGEVMAKIFNKNINNISASALETGGAVENIGLVTNEKSEIAFVQNDVTYYASTGTEIFSGKEKINNIRGIAMLYPEVVQIITTANSGIESVLDLKGKKVAVGAIGSGTEVNARQVLEVYGITYNDLKQVVYLSFNEAVDQLINEEVDVAFVTGAIPTAAVTDVADIVVIQVDSAHIIALNEKYPFYSETIIPANSYSNQTKDVTAPAVMAMLVVPESLDDYLVYNLTKQLFENRQVLIDAHTVGNDFKLETGLRGMPIKLHPGAQSYYDEKGIL